MKYDVFISYSSLDQKVAEGVCAYLEEHRIRCFVAYRDIPKGVVWARAIVEALDESRMMLIVFSENFNRSDQVDREIELASDDQKPILTFRITNDAFKGAKKYYLKNLNWIDAFPNPSQCFGELCKNVQALLDIKEEAPISTTAASQRLSAEEAFEKGWEFDLKKEYEKAAYYYRQSAEQGYADAQCCLGVCYEFGNGVTKDLTEALRWYHKAAEQGDAGTQFNLGLRYTYGRGVIKDLTEAVKWFRKAAERENAGAQNCLGRCYHYGEGLPQDIEEAIKWYRKAAEQGHADAQYNLGWCYYKGNGVPKDLNEARKWLQKAAYQGHDDAKFMLESIL